MVAPYIVSSQVSKDGIMGMNVIRGFNLGMDPHEGVYIETSPGHAQAVDAREDHCVSAVAETESEDNSMTLQFAQTVAIQARNKMWVKVKVRRANGLAVANSDVSCDVAGVEIWLHTDAHGNSNMFVPNASCELMKFARGDVLGPAVPLDDSVRPMPSEAEVSQVSKATADPRPAKRVPLDPKLVDAAIHADVTGQIRANFSALIHQYDDVVSRDKHDLGLTDTVVHDVELSDIQPVYTQQYRLPVAQLELVKEHLAAWIKSGIVEPAHSKYNSPVFCVPKKEGHGLRVVLDYRKLNAKSLPDKYSIKSVEQCLEEVGTAGSSWFSCLDLRSGFWQLKLAEKARPLTAFTIPGVGQFQYCVAPMGLAGSPASFSRLMDVIMKDLTNIITYIDDCLIHSRTPREHHGHLEDALMRLREHGLKINLDKCTIATRKIQYLGHQISGQGVSPGMDKAAAVSQASPPSNVKQVRSFVGLCNYFRGFIPNFAVTAAPLFKLTRADTQWEGGKLPEDARQAFYALQKSISSKPILAFPTKDGQLRLYTDAALGDANAEGGLGAALMQMQNGKERVIAYASRRLIKHEKNYPAFLVELQAATWACEQFAVYLTGRRFVILTDHKPLVRLATVHTKTFNRLQLKMTDMFPEIQHVKGKDNPVADFLSRYDGLAKIQEQPKERVEQIDVASVDMSPFRVTHLQAQDPEMQRILTILQADANATRPRKLEGLSRPVALIDGVLVVEVPSRAGMLGAGSGLRIWTPKPLQAEVVREAHKGTVAGHGGIHRTAERLKGTFWWSNMEQQIANHIARCTPCQATSTKGTPPTAPLQPIKVPNGPNERVHIDLFGPIKGPNREKGFVLVMTDAFSKMVALAAIDNKEPATVAEAFLNAWVYNHGSPKVIISDQGREFVAAFSKAVWTALNIEHRVTTPYHPQTNAQAEVFNKTLAGYLRACIYEREDQTTSWKSYLPALAFSHNSAHHTSAKSTPFMVMHGYDPRVPMWQDAGFMQGLGTNPADLANADAYAKLAQTQITARRIVHNNLQGAQDDQRRDFDRRNQVAVPAFQADDLVWAQIMHTTDPNRKLAPKYQKAVILERMTATTYRIRRVREGRGRKVSTVNAAHLKPRTDGDEHPPDGDNQQRAAAASAVNAEWERKWTPAEAVRAFERREVDHLTPNLLEALRKAGYVQHTIGGGGGAQPAGGTQAPPPNLPRTWQTQIQAPKLLPHQTHPQWVAAQQPPTSHWKTEAPPLCSPDNDDGWNGSSNWNPEAGNPQDPATYNRHTHLMTPDDTEHAQQANDSIQRFEASRAPLRRPTSNRGGKGVPLNTRRAEAGLLPTLRYVEPELEELPDYVTPADKPKFFLQPSRLLEAMRAKGPTYVNRELFSLRKHMRGGPNDPDSSDLGVEMLDPTEVRSTRRWTRSMFSKKDKRHGAANVVDMDQGGDIDLTRSIVFLNSGRHATISR